MQTPSQFSSSFDWGDKKSPTTVSQQTLVTVPLLNDNAREEMKWFPHWPYISLEYDGRTLEDKASSIKYKTAVKLAKENSKAGAKRTPSVVCRMMCIMTDSLYKDGVVGTQSLQRGRGRLDNGQIRHRDPW
ncbi:hypothetical protein SARC_10742 [Sphaeroforma arctica JP610]|uniref:Uncharacterized protein n=1 Tax=Sphaeroforma arctica JP610 TaxID=667725 RepID=A0A0L0FJ15_9EUKA|nr:hypothetical protein SARC_10742 [Sphaeroforma arctica JP610]KNC76774.1 hypothetical protein SARC_10742 [Sphaeroforma arctica JP610]|eukprot:XP_014150676.1 hypothetical protein SARC_10742 [Sphaeroforma arctica JP610]